jgi:hypothetical protein
MVMPPSPLKPFGIRHWGFAVGGIVFVLKADKRSPPAGYTPPKINGRTDYAIEARLRRAPSSL